MISFSDKMKLIDKLNKDNGLLHRVNNSEKIDKIVTSLTITKKGHIDHRPPQIT